MAGERNGRYIKAPPAIILRRDRNTRRTTKSPGSEGYFTIPYSTARRRRVASSAFSLVLYRPDACWLSLDRSTDDRSADAAALPVLVSQHDLSRTLQVHSAQPNFA